MDPIITGSLISAGTSLLGGLFGSSSKRKAEERARQQHRKRFVHLRKDAEKAGFNPLTAMQSGSINAPVPTGSSMMGNAIAQAGMAIGSGLADKAALDIERSRLKMDQQKLDKLLTQATIKPNVGGIYAARRSTPKKEESVSLLNAFKLGTKRAGSQELLYPEEIDRAEISAGGTPTDATIYETGTPMGRKWQTAFPGMGQRMEDDYGEIMSAPAIIPYIVNDVANNVMGNTFDPVSQVWRQPPSKWMAEQNRAKDQQKVWANDRADRKQREAAQKRRQKARQETRDKYSRGIPTYMRNQ